ncbi:MEDS domain-containing protein [Streptomyces platensis]|uniref:MEDS domain-containing protein n=1 Tax=Streptomyces platensis TaxID=58346 RepID=UPI00386D3334|nr:MEDS domain-containing protein [Streptomyces platensis]
MAARDTRCGRLRPVQHLRPGDHAFVGYGDDEVRWEVVTAFVRLGPARGEKMLVLPSPGVPEDEVPARIDFPSRSTVRARERGQLTGSSMREVIAPDREFTAARQMSRLRAQTDRATAEGHTGLRAFTDMGWVRALGADVAVMAARETGAQALFSGHPYTEICAYDRRGFDHTMLILARDAAGHERIEVRCDRGQRRLLRRLGAGTVSRLVLTEVVRAW